MFGIQDTKISEYITKSMAPSDKSITSGYFSYACRPLKAEMVCIIGCRKRKTIIGRRK